MESLQPPDTPFKIARKSVVVIFVRHRPNCEKAHFGAYHRGCDSSTASPAAKHNAQATIAQLVETFITRKESENINAATIRKLRYQLSLFEQFTASRTKFYPSDITPQDVIDFRASWKSWGDLTRIKAQQNLRGFLRFSCDGNRQTVLDAL